ncbi:MAG: HD domain-containing protein [Clostridia bacterium]
MQRIMLNANSVKQLLKLSQEDVKLFFGNEVAKMVGYEQNNPNHKYNLWEHTLHTMNNIPLDEFNKKDTELLRVSTLFHDIGKPNTMKEKDGINVFWGHAEESAKLSEDILKQIGYSQQDIQKINLLIGHHGDFINIKDTDAKKPDKVAKILSKSLKEIPDLSITDFEMLLDLCIADIIAQADVIEQNGKVKDTKENRLKKYSHIKETLPSALSLPQNSEISRLNKKITSLNSEPVPIEKNGTILNQRQINAWRSKTEDEKKDEISTMKASILTLEEINIKLLTKREPQKEVVSKEKAILPENALTYNLQALANSDEELLNILTSNNSPSIIPNTPPVIPDKS